MTSCCCIRVNRSWTGKRQLQCPVSVTINHPLHTCWLVDKLYQAYLAAAVTSSFGCSGRAMLHMHL